MLALAAAIFLPHPAGFGAGLALLPVAIGAVAVGARPARDGRREAAHPARAPPARGGRGHGPARGDHPPRGGRRMSGGVVWIVVALGLGVPTLRRRSVAIALVTAQALLLAATAAVQADGLDELVAAAALLVPRRPALRAAARRRAAHARGAAGTGRRRAARARRRCGRARAAPVPCSYRRSVSATAMPSAPCSRSSHSRWSRSRRASRRCSISRRSCRSTTHSPSRRSPRRAGSRADRARGRGRPDRRRARGGIAARAHLREFGSGDTAHLRSAA